MVFNKKSVLDWKTSTWSSNAYVVYIDWSAYFDRQTIKFTANHANTWAATLSISWKTARAIKKKNDQDLVSWDINEWQIVIVSFNEEDNIFEMISKWSSSETDIADWAVTTDKIADWAVTADKIAEWVLKVDTITITSAEILALNATPKELVAAPWAWKVVVVDKIVATVDYATTAYTTNTTLEVKYGTATTKVSADITWLLTATADKSVSVWGIEAELVNAINDNIEINVATWEALAWDSDVKVNVVYRILSI